MKKNNQPIGFLDSGIGGSTVLTRALKILPNEDYVFFSDSAYNPYGDKSDEAIINRCNQIVEFLINEHSCKAVVIACNTASAKAVAQLRQRFSTIPFIAIEPAYKMVHDKNPDGFTLVMATKGTLESEKFHRLYYKYNNHRTKLLACVGLADVIEKGDKGEIEEYLFENLKEYRGKVDNVVLGCTHYPLVKNEIAKALGSVKFFDGAEGVSRQLKRVLAENDLLNPAAERGSVAFFDSSADEQTRKLKEQRFYKIISEDNI